MTAQSLDELDDWLAAHDPGLVAQLRRIRQQEDLAGKGKDLRELLRQCPIG